MIKSLISSKFNKPKAPAAPKKEIVGTTATAPPEDPMKVADRPSPCMVLAVVITLFVLIIMIIGLGQFGLHDPSEFNWHGAGKNKPLRTKLAQPCQTQECVRYSAELFEMSSDSIDQCTDFHQHVCEGFDPKKRKLERLLKLIDTDDSPDRQKAVGVVRKMLSKCAVEKDSEWGDGQWKKSILPPHLKFPILRSNWTHLVPITKNFAKTSNATSSESESESFDLTSLLIHVSRQTPEDLSIFGILPSQDSEFSLYIVKPKTRSLTEYELRNILEILMPHGGHAVVRTSEDMERQLRNVVALQDELKGIPFETRPEVVPISEIRKQMPIIDWNRLIGSWYRYNGTTRNYTLKNKVFGFNTSYYKRVSEIVSSHPPETLYNLILLRWTFTFLRHKLTANREETCLEQVSTTIPGKIVLYGSAEPDSQKLMDSMLQVIRNHLSESLTRVKWMDTQGIEEARRKFDKTEFRFGFTGDEAAGELRIGDKEDYVETLSRVLGWQTRNMFEAVAVNRENVFLQTHVFYSVETNRITISRALLHYPFISSQLPAYTNFATIASRILPHLIHVFDERGRFYDSHGAHRDWWNSETKRYFRVIVECFDGMMQNVLGVSVSIGLNAYNSTRAPYAVLPGWNLTDTTLFFYSYVKTMCDSEPEKVNNALASVPQFIEAFQCTNMSRMNHKTKCRLAS